MQSEHERRMRRIARALLAYRGMGTKRGRDVVGGGMDEMVSPGLGKESARRVFVAAHLDGHDTPLDPFTRQPFTRAQEAAIFAPYDRPSTRSITKGGGPRAESPQTFEEWARTHEGNQTIAQMRSEREKGDSMRRQRQQEEYDDDDEDDDDDEEGDVATVDEATLDMPVALMCMTAIVGAALNATIAMFNDLDLQKWWLIFPFPEGRHFYVKYDRRTSPQNIRIQTIHLNAELYGLHDIEKRIARLFREEFRELGRDLTYREAIPVMQGAVSLKYTVTEHNIEDEHRASRRDVEVYGDALYVIVQTDKALNRDFVIAFKEDFKVDLLADAQRALGVTGDQAQYILPQQHVANRGFGTNELGVDALPLDDE